MSWWDSVGAHVTQSALDRGDIRSNPDYVNYHLNSIYEGVVVGIHYPGDKDNIKAQEITYDIDPTSISLTRVRYAPRVDVMAGVDDGDDSILRVATQCIQSSQTFNRDGGPGNNTPITPRSETDGDRVLFGFVNGNFNRPVIFGVLTHFQTRRGFNDVRGNALPKGGALLRRVSHRGTELLVDANGNVSVDFAPTPDTAKSDKKTLTITLGSLTFTIDNMSAPTTLQVTDPNGSKAGFKFDKDNLTVEVSGNVNINADGGVTVQSSGQVAINGSNVVLNGGGAGISRIGDATVGHTHDIDVSRLAAPSGGGPVTGTATALKSTDTMAQGASNATA